MSRLRARAEDGMTLIEVVVATLLIALSVAALGDLFATGNASSLGTQREAQLLGVANQALESIRDQVKTSSVGFNGLALSSAPATGANCPSYDCTASSVPSNPSDPNDFVTSSGNCLLVETNWNAAGSGGQGALPGLDSYSGCGASASSAEPLVVCASGGSCATGVSTGFVAPQTTIDGYTVDQYVTETDAGCNSSLAVTCGAGGAQSGIDARRVVIAVLPGTSTATAATSQDKPVWLSTILTNPVPSNQPNASTGLTVGLQLG
ncbi:MAG TPA: type II secretion system protein [Solirubrobacteraceae bacterium]|jgi:type II secretory pathway pseudopilin PulG|nr:type II secretion system protein [Solirubrobacteraceae bacterium]